MEKLDLLPRQLKILESLVFEAEKKIGEEIKKMFYCTNNSIFGIVTVKKREQYKKIFSDFALELARLEAKVICEDPQQRGRYFIFMEKDNNNIAEIHLNYK